MTVKHRADFYVDELAGALCDPFIVFPGGWGNDTPQWLKEQATIERLILAKNGSQFATDTEATIYLMSASLDAPLGHDWTEIYLYVAGIEFEKHSGKAPGDLKIEKLSDYHTGMLNHLKHWIYTARVKHRKEKSREITHPAKEVKQPKLRFEQKRFEFEF